MNSREAIKDKLVEACHRAYRRGLQTGNGGNVSARVPGENLMYVTASGGSFGDSTPDSFVLTDFYGNVVEGNAKPTREVLLHGYLYRIKPDLKAVVHTHSPYAIAWASTDSDLPLTTWHANLKLPRDIPVLDIKAAVVPEDQFDIIGKIFVETPNLPAFILKDHGIVALDDTDAIGAEHTGELIEETSQIAVLKSMLKTI